jgi:hypothetical protein
MLEAKKKGFWAKLFGSKKSSCCNLKIEEVPEEPKKDIPKKNEPEQSECCCNQHLTKDVKPKQ